MPAVLQPRCKDGDWRLGERGHGVEAERDDDPDADAIT
jgi:hypothetical protein